ncbi:type 4a pilus biogenesis protein PilO [Salinisphaera sp. SPP-AMP-43]|uniref:type 4a pilus biogenesis protein PilO n=1 Tax=Salinisphaera sp. SPP-AMP-43 TaxID=3121288 RepID=UPI003C6E5298
MRALGEYIDELRSLDQNNIGSWPTWAYGLAISVVSLVIMLIAAWYFVLPKRDALADARRQESQLKQTYKIKQHLVTNLDAYRDQLDAMRAEFGNLLAQLPSRTEVPSLLRDISQTRSENGLDEELFKPKPEIQKDFYAVLPNALIVTGDFHDFGQFVSDVAALPRIVTISDVHIESVRPGSPQPTDASSPGLLRMSLTASTYRYLGTHDSAEAGP